MFPLLAVVVPAALAADPPTTAEAHALAAGSFRLSGGPVTAGPSLDFARLQGVVRHDLEDGAHVGVMVQVEGTAAPTLLDAVGTWAPSEQVRVDIGLQRTWVSELYDIVAPRLLFLGRTVPEALVPARRAGGQVTLGEHDGAGSRVNLGLWAPPGATTATLAQSSASVVGEHQTEAGLLVHAAGNLPLDDAGAGAGQLLGADVAVGYVPKRSRLMAEVALQRNADDAFDTGVALYASHLLDGSRWEPAAVVDGLSTQQGLDLRARVAGTMHLVPRHAHWTTELGVTYDHAGDIGYSGGTRLMVGF